MTVAGQRHDTPGAVPRARDAEPARAGGHLSAARSAARPLPVADRRQLSRPRRRAAHAVCDDRQPRRRNSKPCISAQELMAIQRLVRQIPVPDKVVEAILKLVRAARPGTGADERDRPLRRVGSGPARQPSPDAGRSRQGPDRRPARAVGRRRHRARRADPEAPHGADVRGPRRRRGSRPASSRASRAAVE